MRRTAAVLTTLALALTWLCAAMGLNARSVETASNTPMIILLLPFLGSGFVPVETMPSAVRWFAEHRVLMDGARTIIFR